MRHLPTIAAGLISTLVIGGCPAHVWSPPSQFMPLESPATLAPGETSVGGELGLAGGVFGPDLVGGAIVVHRGLADGLALRADLSTAWITNSSDSTDFRGMFAGRIGLKGAVVPGWPHLAWFAGVGGGASAMGGFVAGDSGFILGYENPTVVPFLRVGTTASIPIGPQAVDVSDGEAEEPDTSIASPEPTFGVRLGLGVRVPLGRADLFIGLDQSYFIDTTGEDLGTIGVSTGVSARF